MNCIECGHKITEGKKTYVANLDNCVIIIKNVPALICENCKEVYYSDEIFEQIENIVDKMKSIVNDVVILDYSKSVA